MHIILYMSIYLLFSNSSSAAFATTLCSLHCSVANSTIIRAHHSVEHAFNLQTQTSLSHGVFLSPTITAALHITAMLPTATICQHSLGLAFHP